MDATTMNYGTVNPAMGMGGMNMYGGNPFPGMPMSYDPAQPQPTYVGSLSDDEIKMIAQKKPNKIDINIDQPDLIRSMCNHKHNGMDMVKELNDGTGRVYCPMCQAVWTPTQVSKEELQDAVDMIYNQMQNAKWAGDYSIDLIRDYFPMGELLKKFPDLYEFAMKQFNRYLNAGNYTNANDAAVFQQFNNMMYGTPSPMGFYGAPQQQMPYGQQPMYGQPQQAPMYNQTQGYQQGVVANPYNNPMQQMAPGQFGNQADMMMGGGYYQQQPQYAPVGGQAPVAPPQQAAPVNNPAPAATNTTSQDANGDGKTASTVTLS